MRNMCIRELSRSRFTLACRGSPTVTAEAMAEGLPVVTRRMRVTPDNSEENVRALFVEPRKPGSRETAIERL